jgi:hypothetical protein
MNARRSTTMALWAIDRKIQEAASERCLKRLARKLNAKATPRGISSAVMSKDFPTVLRLYARLSAMNRSVKLTPPAHALGGRRRP